MGGLDDLIPDDADTSSTSRSQSGSSSSQQEFIKTFSSANGTKKFTEERWDEIKEVIREDMEFTVGEVETMQASERHKVLHEAAMASNSDYDPEELEYGTDLTCFICDKDCSYSYVELEDEPFCINHTAAQVAKALGKEVQER